MTRLNAENRDVILCRAITHRFGAAVAELSEQQARLASTIYQDVYGDKIKKFDAFPKGWLPSNDHVQISAAGIFYRFNFNGSFDRYSHRYDILSRYNPVTDSINRPFPSCDNGRTLKVYDADDDIAQQCESYATDKSALSEQIQTVTRQIKASLDKFHTVKQLLTEWPEIEPFTEGLAPLPKTMLPAIPTQQLNDLLQLPVDTGDE